MSPLIPLGLLLAGTAVLLVSLSSRFPYAGASAVITAALTCLTTLALGWGLPAQAELSAWGQVSLLPNDLQLSVDGAAWLPALATTTVCLAALLTGLARPGGQRLAPRAASLLLTFAGLAALSADNLVTLVMAWAGLDFIYFLTLILLARGEGVQPQAVLHLTFNSLGTLLALAAALLVGRERVDLTLHAAITAPGSALLMTLAAVFRLGLFPLHLGLPVEANTRQGLGLLLRLIPAAVAFMAAARLAAFGFADGLRPWLTVFGVAALLVGSAQLWSSPEPRQGLTFVVIAQSGLALLVGLWGGAQALSGVIAQTLTLLLGGALVFLANGYDELRPWASALPGLGVAVLAGIPATAGFVGLNVLYSRLLDPGHWALWPALAGVVVAQAVLVGGLLRAVSWPGDPIEGGTPGLAGYVTGLVLLSVFGVLPGVAVEQFGAIMGVTHAGVLGLEAAPNWIALAVSLGAGLAGIGLWRFETLVRGRTESAAQFVTALLRLDWLYRLVWGALRVVDRLVYQLAGVLEGEGALLWALVVALAVMLLFRA